MPQAEWLPLVRGLGQRLLHRGEQIRAGTLLGLLRQVSGDGAVIVDVARQPAFQHLSTRLPAWDIDEVSRIEPLRAGHGEPDLTHPGQAVAGRYDIVRIGAVSKPGQ